jgi:hypothetical protein
MSVQIGKMQGEGQRTNPVRFRLHPEWFMGACYWEILPINPFLICPFRHLVEAPNRARLNTDPRTRNIDSRNVMDIITYKMYVMIQTVIISPCGLSCIYSTMVAAWKLMQPTYPQYLSKAQSRPSENWSQLKNVSTQC